MSKPRIPFEFCPRCASPALDRDSDNSIRCTACGFVYFHNNAAAAGVVIWHENRVLFIERDRNPSRGLLDVPGGFVDYGETLEAAAIRETFEETGVVLEKVEYLASIPNVYRYADVTYQTCDAYFQVRFSTRPRTIAGDDTANCQWHDPRDLAPQQLAFESTRKLHQLLIPTP